jgi:urea transport system substrate-binding protein
MRGTAGIWGPSCVASARLAEAELNRLAGIAGRPCVLRLVDASDESLDVEESLTDLFDAGQVDALVGMCTSSVRRRIIGAINGSVPFIYTCLYEGGDTSPGLFAIGETSARQLKPSIAWLNTRKRSQRWMLVGNDYVWPRVSHRIARRAIGDAGGEVVGEVFLHFGTDDFSKVLEQIKTTRADAVLISMVGQDAVEFNRAFGRQGLHLQALRLSCAIEENQLLAIGAENTENLHVALGYFATLQTDANESFKERYHARFGERAPTLNSIGQSLYEGMHFLAALVEQHRMRARGGSNARSGSNAPTPKAYPSARNAMFLGAGTNEAPIYLARAEGHNFQVLTQL